MELTKISKGGVEVKKMNAPACVTKITLRDSILHDRRKIATNVIIYSFIIWKKNSLIFSIVKILART